MESELIKESIKKLYGKLSSKTLECYSLHLKLAKDFPVEFPTFLMKVKVAEQCESERKRKLLNNKFKQLISPIAKVTKPVVQNLEEFVVNRSSQTFSEEQLTLLNKGLNHAITSRPNINNIIIDLETGIRDKYNKNPPPPSVINGARAQISSALREEASRPRDNSSNDPRIVKELKEKPVFYLKADKGNKVVIMDQDDYDGQLKDKLDNGPYLARRTNPLEQMIKDVDNTLTKSKPLFDFLGIEGAKILKVSNPTLPRIKALPKVHKPGLETREIISAIDAPTYKISKWLVKEFKEMPKPFSSRSVNNTQQFTQQLLEIGQPAEDEIMVSFDVKALFPSVPVRRAIGMLRDWLGTQYEGTKWKQMVNHYANLVKCCMDNSYFVFRGCFYRQTQGAPMGDPLAPFLSEIFMANLEQRLQERNVLPERWWRYVDDVFCIIKRDSLTAVLDTINSIETSIKFTYETEINGRLPFLDILIVREPSLPTLSFEIYRKPTNTRRTIPATSNHSHQHKMAAYHHMIHRMQTLPLSDEGKTKELDYIYETARINGYQTTTIQAIINKKTKDLHKQSLTTLTPITQPLRRVAVDFDYNLTRPLRSKLDKFGIDLVFTSRNNQLQTMLGTTKDTIETLEKPGIYKVTCEDCDMIYIGQTKRRLKTRLNEHLNLYTKPALAQIKKGLQPHFQSAVTEHIITQGHNINAEDATIIRHITRQSKLDVAESIEIYKEDQSQLLNTGPGNAYSYLFKYLLPTPHNDSRLPTPL